MFNARLLLVYRGCYEDILLAQNLRQIIAIASLYFNMGLNNLRKLEIILRLAGYQSE